MGADQQLYFVQVKAAMDTTWITVGAGASRDSARRAARDWCVFAGSLEDGGVQRVVSEGELEDEGGDVAVARAVASLHAQAYLAQDWLSLG